MEPGSQIVGVVARLEPEKGHPTLLEAWPRVLRAVPGRLPADRRRGQSRREALEAQARELRIAHRVVFTGRRDDVPAVTAALDVAVLPSYREAQGLSILEAMALSRPVVASNVGGIPEMIEDGVTGLLVPPHDAEALAAAIVRLLPDHPYADTLGRAGHDLVHDRFCIELMVSAVQTIYDEGARASARPRSPPQVCSGRLGPSGRCRGAPRPASIAGVSLARLWAFLAVALPGPRGAPRARCPTRRPHLPPAGRRGDPRRAARIPTRRHVDVHRGRAAVGRPAVGRPGHPRRASTASAAGPGSSLLRAAAGRRRSSGACSSIARRRGLDAATAALLTLAAFVVAAAGAGAAAAAARDGLLRGRPAARRRSPRASRARCGSSRSSSLVWANLHGSFFLGPVVLGLAWLEDVHDRRAGRAPARSLVARRQRRRRLRDAVRAGGLGVRASACRRTRRSPRRITEWQPTSLRTVPGHPVLRVGARGRRAASPGAAAPTPWPTLAWLGGLLR